MARQAPDTDPATWSTETPIIDNYDFGDKNGSPPPDGRTFGLDVVPVMSGSAREIVHIAMGSTAAGQPKTHAQAAITSTPFSDSLAPATTEVLGTYQTIGLDGVVTGVPGAQVGGPFVVFDFGGVSQSGTGAAEGRAFLLDDDGTGSAQVDMSSFALAPPPGAQLIQSRALLGLDASKDFVAVWNDPGSGLRASFSPSIAWAPTTTLDSAHPPPDRQWAACAEQGNAHVLWVSGGAFYQQWLPSMQSSWVPMVAPTGLSDAVSDLFVACGAGAVVVFAIVAAPSSTFAPGTIVMSSLTAGSWSPWSVAVAPNYMGPSPLHRCYLSGFDRVVQTPQAHVGLIWTESAGSCDATSLATLMTAIVPAL